MIRFFSSIFLPLGTCFAQVAFQVPDIPTGKTPTAIVKADFNGDGIADLATLNYGDKSISVLLGAGDGTFPTRIDTKLGTGPRWLGLEVADFNQDGRPDLAVLNAAEETVSILLGNGDGTFSRTDFPTARIPWQMVIADLNSDGIPDIAITGLREITLLFGQGDGTFRRDSIQTDYLLDGLAAADFDGDGKIDLAASWCCEMTGWRGRVLVWLGNGDGSFRYFSEVVVNGPHHLAAGDFRGTGVPDLIVGAHPCFFSCPFMTMLINDGHANFSVGSSYPVGDFGFAFLDIDGDGTLDIIAPGREGPSDPGGVAIFLNNGNAVFRELPVLPCGARPVGLAVADFNRDGQLDLAVANTDGNSISLLMGLGDVTFSTPDRFAVGRNPRSIVTADFNGDGAPDLVTANLEGLSVSVLLGNGDGTFQPRSDFPIDSEGTLVIAADLNGDGAPDLAVTSYSSVSVLLNQGNGVFGNPTMYSLPPLSGLVAGDFNEDGSTDLAVLLRNNTVALLLGNGDGSFQQGPILDVGRSPQAIVTADFNNDGHADIAVSYVDQGGQTGGITLLFGNGDDTFNRVDWPTEISPGLLLAADFNNDGNTDLIFSRYLGPSSLSVLLGNGDGTFEPLQTTPIHFNPGSMSAADFNQDGFLDIALLGGAVLSVVLGNGDGTFRSGVDELRATAYGLSLTTADFNGDGWPDIAIAAGTSGGANATVLYNIPSRGFGTQAPGKVVKSIPVQP